MLLNIAAKCVHGMFVSKQAPPRAPDPPNPPPLLSNAAMLLMLFAALVLLLFWQAEPPEKGKPSPRRIYALTALWLTATSMALPVLEPDLSAVDAFYLSCMTFTTIGYGDIAHPSSAGGRVLISALAITGVGFFGGECCQPPISVNGG